MSVERIEKEQSIEGLRIVWVETAGKADNLFQELLKSEPGENAGAEVEYDQAISEAKEAWEQYYAKLQEQSSAEEE